MDPIDGPPAAPVDAPTDGGGDYTAQLENVSALSDEDLSALESQIVAAFDAADQSDDLTAMSAAADALDQVRAELANRGGGAGEVDETDPEDALDGGDDEAAEAGALPVAAAAETIEEAVVDGETGTEETPAAVEAVETAAVEATETGVPAAEAEADAPADAAAEPENPDAAAPADAEGATADATTEVVDATPEAVAASGADTSEEGTDPVDIPEDRKPVTASARPPVRVLAGADISGVGAGAEFKDLDQVSRAFIDRINATRGAGGDGVQHLVASIVSDPGPEDRQFDANDSVGNMEKFLALAGKPTAPRGPEGEALIASGGYCAPLESRYDVFGIGDGSRPVRDALTGFNAARGGIRFITPPIVSDYSDGVTLWTNTNDITPSSPATKPTHIVTCGSEQTVYVDAVPLQLQFGNLMTRAYPEMVARHNELSMIYHSRYAEQQLLVKLTAASTAVSSAQVLGTFRDFLVNIGRAASYYRNRHRLDRTFTLQVIVPQWVHSAMIEDLTYQVPGDNAVANAEAYITKALSDRNVQVAWHLDEPGSWTQGTGAAVVDFPASFNWYIFAPGTFLFLDGGTLDLGVVRDSTLVGTNDYKMFVESFEGVAKVGVESLKVATTTKVLGRSSIAVTTS